MRGPATPAAVLVAAALCVACFGCERAKTAAPAASANSDIVTNLFGTPSCKIDRGSVLCKGLNNHANLGLGAKGPSTTEFSEVPGINDAVSVGVGVKHVCAAHQDGHVSCWGSLLSGLMGRTVPEFGPDTPGNDDSLLQARPGRVPGLTAVVQVVAGSLETCARKKDGAVVCWGATSLQRDTASPLNRVADLPSSVRLFAGSNFVCSLAADHRVFCWGSAKAPWDKPAQLWRPTVVFNAPDVTKIELTTGAICYDKRAVCWGDPD